MVSVIAVRDVSKNYRRGKQEVEVLHHINLEIEDGDFVSLMGPSGSGKTTLLNLIGGIDRATSGEVMVLGHRLESLNGNQLARWRSHNIGFIFQFYNLMPTLTAERNVELPLLLTSLSAAQRRASVSAALELVGLSDRARHRPSELSGGQQQRIAIARAIVADPKILVCDEPTGDLDRDTADEILHLLQLLNREFGKTIVMVTHDAQASEFARRTVFLDKGTLAGRETAAAA